MLLSRAQFKLIGWQGPVGGFLTLVTSIFMVWIWQQQETFLRVERMVEIIVPLSFGLHAAILCSIELENRMEILMTCKKPLSRIFLNRYIVSALIWSAIAFSGMLFTSILIHRLPTLEDFFRWFSAVIFLSGSALYTTIVTRQSVFGAFVVFLMWAGMLIGGDALLTRWPIFTLIHVYLQPQTVSLEIYIINRSFLIFSGTGLIFLALMYLQNEENILI